MQIHDINLKLSYLEVRWPCVVTFIRKTSGTPKVVLELAH